MLRIVLLVLLLLMGSSASSAEDPPAATSSESTLPDIVLIMLDDLDFTDVEAYQDLLGGTYGNLFIETPQIDALANAGVLFDQYYSMGPVCSPTRASMLSGRFPSHLGVRRAITRGSYRGLPYDLDLLPAMLDAEGYHTMHVGKWHLGFLKDGFLPTSRGFDCSVRRVGGDYWDYEISVDHPDDGSCEPVAGTPLAQPTGHLTEFLTDRAIDLVEHAPIDEPLFLNLWYFAPHGPIQPPDPGACPQAITAEAQVLADFACLVEYADAQIGQLIAEITAMHRGRDLLVIVTSDNGGTETRHVAPPNRYLEGYKTQVFDGGIRVPMIARWFDGSLSTGTGRVESTPVTSFDWYPTFAELVGATSVASGLEGTSFLDLLKETGPADPVFDTRTLVWETKLDNKQPAPPMAPLEIPNTFAVRQGDWKYVDEGGVDHLFDLGADPREMTNLAASDPMRVDAMRDHYFDWRAGSDITTDSPTLYGDVVYLDPLSQKILDFGPNGYAELGEVLYNGQPTVDSRLDFHDGDFSFATRVQLDSIGAEAVIAGKEDSWQLLVTDDGTLRLIVVGGPTDDTSLLGPATVDAPAPFAAGEEVHVAFTVAAYRKDAQVIRLFVDGAEVARSTSEIANVGPSDALIRLGNNGSSTAPWLGTIERPRLSVNAFYPCEVEADFDEEVASVFCSAP